MRSIFEIKESEVTETPLLLFDCELNSGSVERWSTHAVTYEGLTYKPRVIRHSAFAIRSHSEDGIDTVAKISLVLANPDSYFSQIERNSGWKGAKLTVRFLFFDLQRNEPASISRVVFLGVANPPDEITESALRLSFSNRLSLQRIALPDVRIQRRCPWMFPETREQREQAVAGGSRGKYSPFFRCGYSPDVEGGAGSTLAGVPFSSCNHTRSNCEERGMFNRDENERPTLRFGGVEFIPPSVTVRTYGDKSSHVASSIDNAAKYNDMVPLVYGTAWYRPPVVFARNDGNLTHAEVLLGVGEMEGIVKVIANDVEIPPGRVGTNMTGTGWYNIVTLGDRTGAFNEDFNTPNGGADGDPYGSMAVLSVVLPNRLSSGASLPRIEVLARGLRLERFDSEGNPLDMVYTNNPSWILLDILRRSGWELSELDLASFARTAEYCDERVEVRDLHGNAVSIPQFQCNLVVQKRRSAGDLVRGVRNASGLYLTFGLGGKLQLRPESTLATQHPEKLADSNATEPLGQGWPAYEFGDGGERSGILRRDSGEASVRIWSRSMAETPNHVTVEFQDEFNEYQQDSLSLTDSEDVLRIGQEVSTSLSALGIPNVYQAATLARRTLDQAIRGNTFVEFETSVRALGLTPGDIITITYAKEGFARQPFRIIKIEPGINHETSTITAQIHDDTWFSSYAGDSSQGSRRQPGYAVGLPRPLMGTVLDDDGNYQFEISERAVDTTEGGADLLLQVGFVAPRAASQNRLEIPLISLSPDIETDGGSLRGGETLYYAIAATNNEGDESPLSFLVRASTPEETDENTVTLRNLSFAADATTFHVYRGENPAALMRIASDVELSSEFVDSGLQPEPIGPVDENYDHANFYWRLELQGPMAASIRSENTIGNSDLNMPQDEYRGATIRITKGAGSGQERTVITNNSDTLTVAPRWTVAPDSSSMFVIAESTWHFGAAATASPVEFAIPNRKNATIHISGRSANALDRECPVDTSPLTSWRIGGASGVAIDSDIPPAPFFALFAPGQGQLEITSVSFEIPPDSEPSSGTNTRTIAAGTLTLSYWDELKSPTSISLASGLEPDQIVIEVSPETEIEVGNLIQIGREIMEIQEVEEPGGYRVIRGSHDTPAGSHEAGTPVYLLSRKSFILPFSRDFFGSPASGNYSFPIQLPNARVAAAELFVTNSRGNSDTTRINVTGTGDHGYRTLSGGQMCIQVDGMLAVQTNVAPPLIVQDPTAIRDIFAVVRDAPAGAPIELVLKQNDMPLCELTIQPGEKISNVVDGFGLAPLVAKAQLALDILSVGQLEGTSPGKDLTVTVRL
ncbi:MAG: hypothetical protein HUU41_08785 [Bryobacteraceae bacterium]|nr:phage tail protein [Bryobacterales bacterium]NUN01195.1 hypothetical protein [Bryobacteraceae bacterium]